MPAAQGPATPARAPDLPAASAAPVRVPRWAYPAVTVASLLIGAAAVVRGTRAVHVISDSDLTNFFFKSAQYILNGHPWQMYAVRASGNYPNYNPPLSMFLMAPLLKLAQLAGFAKDFGEQITFVSLPFILFVPLLGFLVLAALRRLYPEMPQAQRLLAFVLVVLSPLSWQSIATWYHLEQPMMLCLLVGAVIAFQARREGLAGLLAGLALMSRTTALIPLIALGMLLLAAGQWRDLFKLAGVAAVVVGMIMAPFFIFDRADAMYSFVTWRGTAQIGGNSIWSIFAYGGHSGIRHTLDAVARRLDMPSVVVFVLIAALLAARRWRISAYGRDAWAVMAVAALAVPMLSKTNWPYYFLEPYIFLLVWEFTSMYDRRPGVWRWPILTIGFLVVSATLSQYIGLQSVGAFDRISVGLLEFGAMLAFIVAVWMRLSAAKPAPSLGAAYTAGTVAPASAVSSAGVQMPAAPTTRPQTPPAPGPARQPWPDDATRPAGPRPGVGPRDWPAPAQPYGAPQATGNGNGWPAQAGPPVHPGHPGHPGQQLPGGSAGPGTPDGRTAPGAPYGPTAQPRQGWGQGPSGAQLPDQWPDLDGAWPPRPPAPRGGNGG